jgi:ParB/RepB/Spo0J family partition protein
MTDLKKKTTKALNDNLAALKPETIGVKYLPTDSLVANPHNPRMLFDKDPLKTLRESIDKVGVLVPLAVYWSEKQKLFVILDGQRRWICAQELGLKEIPVNQIAEPSLVQNIVTMFQIHKNREDWELMPTALKVEVLMRELNEKNERKLSALTGLEPAVVSRCKKLLSYSKKIQDMMLDPDPNKRVKADFFIELHTIVHDRLVMKMDWFSKDKFTHQMLEKYEAKVGLKAVTDFRLMKQHINNARRANEEKEITKRLKEFTESDSLTLDHLIIESADVSASARRLLANITKIETSINEIDVDEYYGEEELWDSLERLLMLIRQKLKAAGRRTKE